MYRLIVLAVVAGLIVGCTAVGRKVDNSEIERTKTGEGITTMMLASWTLSVSIGRHPNEVYEFASNPENMPKWAKGLGKNIRKQGSDWIVDTPRGPLKIRFAEINKFGVLDHYVTTAAGVEVYVPMRVLSNGTGCEVIFTLFRMPEMSDEKYAEDMKLVEQDLRALKDLLEK
jgi:hypothetical protein